MNVIPLPVVVLQAYLTSLFGRVAPATAQTPCIRGIPLSEVPSRFGLLCRVRVVRLSRVLPRFSRQTGPAPFAQIIMTVLRSAATTFARLVMSDPRGLMPFVLVSPASLMFDPRLMPKNGPLTISPLLSTPDMMNMLLENGALPEALPETPETA